MAGTVSYPVLPAYETHPTQHATGPFNVAPPVPPTQQSSIGGQPAGEGTQGHKDHQELPSTSGQRAKDIERATADLEPGTSLKDTLAADLVRFKAKIKTSKNGGQDVPFDNQNLAPNAEEGENNDDNDISPEEKAAREAVLKAGAAAAITQTATVRPRDIDLLWTQCYPAIRSWWSGSMSMGTLKKVNEANQAIAKKNEEGKRSIHDYRIPKEEWMTEIESAVIRLQDIEKCRTGPERADNIVSLIDQLMTWKHKLDKLGVKYKWVIPGERFQTILSLVSVEPTAKRRYDELLKMYCEPTSEQLVQLQRQGRAAMMETLFKDSSSVADREKGLEGLLEANDELAKLNRQLGLQPSDHMFPDSGGRDLIVALKQNDRKTAVELASRIKVLLMLQGDPLYKLINVDVSDAMIEQVKDSNLAHLVASAEDSQTTAPANPSASPSANPLENPSASPARSRGDPMDTEPLFVPNDKPSADNPAGVGAGRAAQATGVSDGATFKGVWKKILGYRRVGHGYQLQIETDKGPHECKLVKASQFGKETVKEYEEARREQGLEPVVLEQTACDLKQVSWDDLFGEGAGIVIVTHVLRAARARRQYVNHPVTYLHFRLKGGSELIVSRSSLGRRFGQGRVDQAIHADKISEFLTQPAAPSKHSKHSEEDSDAG